MRRQLVIIVGLFLLVSLRGSGRQKSGQIVQPFKINKTTISHGNILLNGRVVPKDAARAVVLYKKAELQNNSAALNNLGTCYEQGNGVDKDVNRAIIYFKRAAAAGSADGVANLKRLGK